jgi:putative transposase
MAGQRNHDTTEFKAKVALAAIKGQQTVNEIAATYGVYPHQVLQWKKQALEALPEVFSTRRGRVVRDEETRQARLYQQIGQLKVELDWLKKKLDFPLAQRRQWVEPHHEWISVRRQCRLLGLNRTGLYYQPVEASIENLRLMRLLEEQYTRCPFYGVLRMAAWLRHQGHQVNVKRVRRLLRQRGLMAVYPKPRLSQPGAGAPWYPYLLTGVKVDRPDQVWSTDITYVRLSQGFIYLLAIMDW